MADFFSRSDVKSPESTLSYPSGVFIVMAPEAHNNIGRDAGHPGNRIFFEDLARTGAGRTRKHNIELEETIAVKHAHFAGCFMFFRQPSENYEFVSWDDCSRHIWKYENMKKHVTQSTNQFVM